MSIGTAISLVKETTSDWSDDKAPRLAAALAYYTIFSIAPLMVVVLAILGLVFGRQAAQGHINGQITQLVGPTSAKAIQDMLANARQPSHGILATAIGTATLLLGAGGVFGALQDALNTIWGVRPKPNAGFWHMVKDRFLSFSMVFGLGFLLMVSLVVSAGISAIAAFFGNRIPGIPWLWELLNTVVSFGVFTLMFALIYKVLPDAKVQWRDVWVGSLLTALLFTIGKFAIGLYLGRGAIGSAYGAAGSLVVLLLWIYYSAQILFFGAEFTKVYAKRFGSRIVPEEGAEPISAEARADQGMNPKPTGARPDARPAPRAPAGPRAPVPVHASRIAHSAGVRAAHDDGAIRVIRLAGIAGAAIGIILGLARRPEGHAGR
jgi:membrane protein